MAPSGKYSRAPHSVVRPTPTLRLHPTRLVHINTKAIPTPTPLTREQIEYLVAKASAKTQQKNELGVGQPWTAVPNPVPDTGIHPAGPHDVKSSVPVVSTLSVSPSHVLSLLPLSALSTIPLLLTLAPTEPVITPSITTSPLGPTTTAANQNNVSTQSPPHRLPTGAISLVAIAGAFLLLGLFVTLKLCVRPTRRPLPVPSRPILDDPFPEDDVFETKLEDSPVFGGKERLSERPGNSGLWNWTQYPTPATTTVAPSASYGAQLSRSGAQGMVSYAGEKNHYHSAQAANLVGIPNTQTPANSPYPPPMQQVHSAFTRAANRLSVASASMYPVYPSSNQNYGLITSFTADGHPVMERVNPKVLQRSRSSTVGERTRDRPQSRATRYSYGFAYDGAEVTSPQMSVRNPTIPIAPAMPGRTRIKSSYYAHPRTSAMPPSQSTKANARHENPSVSLHHKSESRSERDIKGLASALGFGSPATIYPSSPQPTLYPDDSLSVVDAKWAPKRVHKKPAPNNRTSRVFRRDEDGLPSVTSPTLDATAALGSLMLMDFGAQSAANLGLTSASSGTLAPKKTASRSDDKPPRVPSPPPLPSLTQMGLEHANPEAYAEYRSPTYSIYGLYEGDRKSRVENSSLHN
ncbi:hypothetical protein DFH07DRAFT_799816 [Mycena maculata]|uniref:Uncharacterized protein n=1 Tax=Mycena maculata TaxID=230809 RepID=A0AAD7NTC4_9AGAR|nr:hypothetical protein DFH07DRAFT_799816 [Mycena maculata]